MTTQEDVRMSYTVEWVAARVVEQCRGRVLFVFSKDRKRPRIYARNETCDAWRALPWALFPEVRDVVDCITAEARRSGDRKFIAFAESCGMGWRMRAIVARVKQSPGLRAHLEDFEPDAERPHTHMVVRERRPAS